jgi:hypothetical protein
MFAEKKKGDKWVKVGNNFQSKTYNGDIYYTDEPYEGRDYEFFALLADVRNHANIKPISEPRGWPDDLSNGLKDIKEYWEFDGHSASYFTLSELKKAFEAGLSKQTIYDPRVITSKDEQGNITSTAAWTNREHFGEVGQVKIFGTFVDEKDPLEELIEVLKSNEEDENIRVVFCFDN